jgi:excisionase family DNA binding protein
MLEEDLSLAPKAAISVAEFCRTCSIGRSSFYNLVAAGRIRIRKLGRRTLVPAGEVAAFLDSLSTPAVR